MSFMALICILFWSSISQNMISKYLISIPPQPGVPNSLPGDPHDQNVLHNNTRTLFPSLSPHSLMSIRWNFPESTLCVILRQKAVEADVSSIKLETTEIVSLTQWLFR